VNLARDPGALSARIGRPGLAARRVIAGAACGCAAAVIALADGASWSVAALCASDVAAVVFNPLVTILGVLAGASLLGILGALLAIPIAAAVQIILRDWWANRSAAPEAG
jgi:hypothetical protein